MGHQVIQCPKCKSHIMEGHSDWFCVRCELLCSEDTDWKWTDHKSQPQTQSSQTTKTTGVFS